MSGDEPGVVGITQRELLLEMREDIRGLKATVDVIARDQALGVERRANMQRSADGIFSRLDHHDRELDDGTVAAIVRALASAPRPIAIDRARIERQIRDLALDHAAGRRLEDNEYLERLRGLREARESLERATTEGISAERAVAWLQILSATWNEADVPEAKAELLHAIYERIVVTGRTIVSIRLTPSAYIVGALGWLLLIPLSTQPDGAPLAGFVRTADPVIWEQVGVFPFVLGALMFYVVLYQSRLVPRWLSAWGLVGAALYIVAPLGSMFELSLGFFMAPLALQEMVMAVWLIAKGFNPSANPAESAAA